MRELFVALDFKTEQEMTAFLDRFEGYPVPVKIGMSQFYMSGPQIVERLAKDGHPIFLDLKCHDIPNTVYLAMRQLSQLPVDLVTVHTMGGSEMMKAAVKGAEDGPYHPKVLGITQLTSTSQQMLNEELQIPGSVEDSVIHLARLAQASGLDGVVSSVQEVKGIKEQTSSDFLSLTPGIRAKKDQKQDDQTRVATPAEAREAGADYLVVGRPITQASDPLKAYQEYLKEWEGEGTNE